MNKSILKPDLIFTSCTLCGLLVSVLCFGDIAAAEGTSVGEIASEDDFTNVIAQLEDPETEMIALRRLIKFAGLFLYNEGGSVSYSTGNPEMDHLRRAAVKAVRSRARISMAQQALDDEDRDIRLWGVWALSGVLYSQPEQRASLLPSFKKIAAEDNDPGVRRAAIRGMRGFKSGHTALEELRASTTEESWPDVLIELYQFNSQKPELRARFYARAIQLLSDPSGAIRLRWLHYIRHNVWNPSTAPMWRIEPYPPLIAKLRDIKHNGNPNERELAAKTLEVFLETGTGTVQQGAEGNPVNRAP